MHNQEKEKILSNKDKTTTTKNENETVGSEAQTEHKHRRKSSLWECQHYHHSNDYRYAMRGT